MAPKLRRKMRRDSESGWLTNDFAVRMGKLDIPMTDRFLHIGSWSFLDAWIRRRPDSDASTPPVRGTTAPPPNLSPARRTAEPFQPQPENPREIVQWIMTTS